jgi:SHS2 domain-containing protein
MPYEIVGHTADVKMKVRGRTFQELFGDALRGMNSILKSFIEGRGKKTRREIAVEAADRSALLVDFLNEALALSLIHREIYTEVMFRELSETFLRAGLVGVGVYEFDEDIKAVTYHEVEIKKNENGEWGTAIVFDI